MHRRYAYFELKTYFRTHWNEKYYLFLRGRSGWCFHPVQMGGGGDFQSAEGVQIREQIWKGGGSPNPLGHRHFETPKDIDDFTICPTHRSNLGTGVGWIRGSNSRCRVPKEVWCWAITPQKIEYRLNGRKHMVQLAKDPLCIKNLMVRPFGHF